MEIRGERRRWCMWVGGRGRGGDGILDGVDGGGVGRRYRGGGLMLQI